MATNAASAAASGSASHPSRQLALPSRPSSGIPTIHAAGLPISVQLSTRPRTDASAQSPAADIETATSTDTAMPSGTCASASTQSVGAAALASAATAKSAAPARSNRLSPRRRTAVGSASDANAAASPATLRSSPTSAVETSNSDATAASTGESAIVPDCAAKRQRKSEKVMRRLATTATKSFAGSRAVAVR